jgi:exopolysaccharide biosynthesis protein
MRAQTNNTNFFSRPYRYAAVFSLLLAAAFVFTLLDAFVIPKALQPVPQNDVSRLFSVREQTSTMDAAAEEISPPEDAGDKARTAPVAAEDVEDETRTAADVKKDIEDETRTVPVVTEDAGNNTQTVPVVADFSYKDGDIEISIETLRVYDTDVYIADVKVSSIAYLKTAFADNTYGRNINDKTSVIAGRQNAIFAINGDYYGFRDSGWVLRNGILYRSGGNDTALLMDTKGRFSCDSDRDSIEKQISNLWQIWSFGPPLVVGGAVSVSRDQEISGRSSISNPRTAIGQAGDLHYIFIVSDGRTNSSAGLSLHELAALFQARGCSVAYNLDGGGSATMYFNGRVINRPTTMGNRIIEREISDIVYIGY